MDVELAPFGRLMAIATSTSHLKERRPGAPPADSKNAYIGIS